MRRRFFRALAASPLALLATLRPAPARGAATPGIALPLMAQHAVFDALPPLPDDATLPLPFTVLDSIPPAPLAFGGLWYLTCYRVDSGTSNGGWLLTWDGLAPPIAVAQLSHEDAADTRGLPTPIEKIGPSRFSLTAAVAVHAWSYPSATGRAGVLRIQRGAP